MSDANEWATFEFQDGGKCPHRNVVRIYLYLDGVERGIALDSIRDFLRECDAKNKAYFCHFKGKLCGHLDYCNKHQKCIEADQGKTIRFTFDYIVRFVPEDGLWGVFAEGPQLPSHAIAWFVTEELANQYRVLLGGKP